MFLGFQLFSADISWIFTCPAPTLVFGGWTRLLVEQILISWSNLILASEPPLRFLSKSKPFLVKPAFLQISSTFWRIYLKSHSFCHPTFGEVHWTQHFSRPQHVFFAKLRSLDQTAQATGIAYLQGSEGLSDLGSMMARYLGEVRLENATRTESGKENWGIPVLMVWRLFSQWEIHYTWGILGNQYQEYLIQGWSGSTQGAPQPDRLHLMELQREVRWAKYEGRYGSLWNDQRKFRSLYFRVTEFQSKEISQQRSHTAQKSHNKEVSHQRSLSQQRSLTASLARKLRFHIFSIQFMREVSHRFHNFNCHFLREVSHEGFVFTSSSFSQLQLSHFEGSLARELRFHIFNFHFWGKFRTKASFSQLPLSSHESFVFTTWTFSLGKSRIDFTTSTVTFWGKSRTKAFFSHLLRLQEMSWHERRWKQLTQVWEGRSKAEKSSTEKSWDTEES